MTVFERTLKRIQNGDTIAVAVIGEYGNYRAYYDKATPEQKAAILQARSKHPRTPGKPLAFKRADQMALFKLPMTRARKEKVKERCAEKGVTMGSYINSLIVADLNK